LPALRKRWEISPPVPTEHLARYPELSPLVVQLLYNRQIRTRPEVEAFLAKDLVLDNPFLLKGMNEAVTRLRQAIRAREAIAVYGDYDVDGVTGTALLVTALSALGARVVPYIPNRIDEGYGLHESALAYLAREGIRVVLTVDCGIRSIDEAAFARQQGLDLIITDHHALGDKLPSAIAIIDPRRDDDRYPFKHLAGVGLAFKLAQALLRAERQVPVASSEVPIQEDDWLDLVALGTVADLAPLIGENRALVCRGLEALAKARRPGVEAMLKESGLTPERLDATAVGFVLAPRLNAAGRLDDALAAYRLLTTDSAEEAEALAQAIGAQNQQRQKMMHEMVEQARQEVLSLGDERIYVLANTCYHIGIAGLVASRITEEFYRPTLIIALEEDESKGSARSIAGLHITNALDECDGLLLRHGGHSAAAGFQLKNENIDALRDCLRVIAKRELTDEDLVPPVRVDAALPLAQANWDTLDLVDQLRPFGIGNPTPTFASYGVQVRNWRCVGRERTGVKMTLSDGTAVWDAIAFGGVATDHLSAPIDVVYSLKGGEWQGRRRLELMVKDLRPAVDKGTPILG